MAGRREITYVFLGINPLLVNVDGDPGSEASKNLRKGFATVIAACRQPGLEQELELGIDNQTWIIDLPVSPEHPADAGPGGWVVSGGLFLGH